MGATFNPRIYIADFGVQNWFFGQFFGRWRWWTRLASIHVLPVSNVSNVSHVSNVSYPLIYPMPNGYNLYIYIYQSASRGNLRPYLVIYFMKCKVNARKRPSS